MRGQIDVQGCVGADDANWPVDVERVGTLRDAAAAARGVGEQNGVVSYFGRTYITGSATRRPNLIFTEATASNRTEGWAGGQRPPLIGRC